jgi:hypothetical protein
MHWISLIPRVTGYWQGTWKEIKKTGRWSNDTKEGENAAEADAISRNYKAADGEKTEVL